MIKIENEFLRIEVATRGAELVGVYDKIRHKERMWSGHQKYWNRISPVLFPIIGRVKDNYTIIGKNRYELTQHGFLRDQTFVLHSQSEQHIGLKYCSEGRHLDVYPFDFEAILTYTLEQNELKISWEIKNMSQETMYYSIGGHPAFAIDPLEPYYFELSSHDFSQQFLLESAHIARQVPVNLSEPIMLTYDNFKDDARIYSNINRVCLLRESDDEAIEVRCEGFDFVGLWANTAHGYLPPFVCIEPWLGITDDLGSDHDFTHKRGIRTLNALEQETNSYTVIYR